MIRRTVARGFGSEDPIGPDVPPAPRATRRDEALEGLWRGLEQGLREAAGRGPPGLELSAPRALPGGVELRLEGPGGAFSFCDTLSGSIEVSRRAAGGDERLEVLSVQRESGGGYRPIRRPWLGPGRSAYRFTSVPELVRGYIAAAAGAARYPEG